MNQLGERGKRLVDGAKCSSPQALVAEGANGLGRRVAWRLQMAVVEGRAAAKSRGIYIYNIYVRSKVGRVEEEIRMVELWENDIRRESEREEIDRQIESYVVVGIMKMEG